MSLYKKLLAEQAPERKEELKPTVPEERAEEHTEEEISAGREQDLRRFFDYLKQKEKTAVRMEELQNDHYHYYCRACDRGFKSSKEAEHHAQTKNHLEKEQQFKRTQYNIGGYSRVQTKLRNREMKVRQAEKPKLQRPVRKTNK